MQSTFRLIFTGIAMVLPGILISKLGMVNGVLNTEVGIRKTVILITILSVLGIYACVFFLKEKQLTQNRPKTESLGFMKSISHLKDKEIILYFLGYFFCFCGFNILRGDLSYYLSTVMQKDIKYLTVISVVLFGMAGMFFPITNKFEKKYSYKKILIVDMLLLIAGTFGLLFINKNNSIFAYVFFVICGAGLSGAAFIFPQAMLSEISAKLSEIKKISLEGFMFGIQGMFLKLAFLVQQVVQSTLLVAGNQNVQNGVKGATELGVKVTLVVALALFGVSLFFYNLKKED